MLPNSTPLSRRSALKAAGALGLAATLPGCASAAAAGAPPPGAPTDADIFNFALNLESLETEYYLRGTTGRGMDAADAGPSPGACDTNPGGTVSEGVTGKMQGSFSLVVSGYLILQPRFNTSFTGFGAYWSNDKGKTWKRTSVELLKGRTLREIVHQRVDVQTFRARAERKLHAVH